jgi:tetratricopeptide (TPR) repeat protein
MRSLPLPTGTLPTGTTSPGPSGHATSQVRTDGVPQEAGLLRQALSALRRDHDAKRALALLDDYDRRFGQGALALEATSARAQALLKLGDNARALELLDRLPLWQERHTGELRVIRGELRSLSGRCPEALSDFDDVLRVTAGNAPKEVARALFGRASCRARTGDLVGAEADRQRYLKEFPQGPAASQLKPPP